MEKAKTNYRNCYKVTSKAVKTFYDVEVSFMNLWTMLVESDFLNNSYYQIKYPHLYEVLKTKDINVRENAVSIIEDSFLKKWRDDISMFLTDLLGFDGLDNVGFYREEKRCWRFHPYKYGDNLN